MAREVDRSGSPASVDAEFPPDVALLANDPIFHSDTLAGRLQSLVRARSVNPDDGESAVATEVLKALETLECDVQLIESLPGRRSIAATVRCRSGGPRLVLNGHMDTVGIDDESSWSSDPFAAEVRDGYLYGRGACDMKAGLTAVLAVGGFVSKFRDRLRGELVMHFAIGEERGEPGTASLIAAGFGGDVGIVAEPTSLNVVVAQRGLAFFDITIAGKSAHAGYPEIGSNPIFEIAEVLEILRAYEHGLSAREHDLLPRATSTPTMVRAGMQPNTIPDACQLTVDRRLLPGESAEEELRALQARFVSLPGVEVALRPHGFRPAEVSRDSPLAAHLAGTTALVTGRSSTVLGAPYATDCSVLIHDGGMEAVVFGPGNPKECHCPDERVALQELREAALVLSTVAVEILAQEQGSESALPG